MTRFLMQQMEYFTFFFIRRILKDKSLKISEKSRTNEEQTEAKVQ